MSKKPNLRVMGTGIDPLMEEFGLAEAPEPEETDLEGRFAQISLQAAAEISEKLGNAGYALLAILAYEAFRAKGQTFELSNDLLTLAGISREIKRRTLARFEEAGVVRVERPKGRSPIVTLLVRLKQ
jgi:hypothetical protein